MAHKFESEMPLEGVVTAEAKLEDFFARNQDFFALYAGDASIKAKPSRELGTFAIDLEKGCCTAIRAITKKRANRGACVQFILARV